MPVDRATRLYREIQYRKCFRFDPESPGQKAEAFAFWCETFVKIKHPAGVRPFRLRRAQRETVDRLAAGEDVVVLKSRQVGFSTLFSNWTLWSAFAEEAFESLFLSRNEREAVQLLKHAKFAYRRLPLWLRERLPRLVDDNQQKMTFSNDSSIESLPSKKDAARGRTARLMIADEFAFLEDQEEAWSSMEPATDVGGQVIVLSTANGAGDLFETLWIKARTKVTDMVPLFYGWWEDEVRDQDWYESKKRTMLPWQLAQEYPANAEEAFIRSGNAVFDIDRLRSMKLSEPLTGEFLVDEHGVGRFRLSKNGPLSVWESPNPGQVYVMGCDIAEGLEHGDRSVATVLAYPEGHMVARYVGRPVPHIFAQHAAALGHWFNDCLIGPERNNHGHAFIRELVTLKYPKIFRHHMQDKKRETETERLGWHTNNPSKAYIIDGLYRYSMDFEIPDEVTVREMLTYVRDENGKMSGSPFDDCVMAMAIAVEMLNHATERIYRTSKKAPRGSYEWYEKTADSEQEERWRLRSMIGHRNFRRSSRQN